MNYFLFVSKENFSKKPQKNYTANTLFHLYRNSLDKVKNKF